MGYFREWQSVILGYLAVHLRPKGPKTLLSQNAIRLSTHLTEQEMASRLSKGRSQEILSTIVDSAIFAGPNV